MCARKKHSTIRNIAKRTKNETPSQTSAASRNYIIMERRIKIHPMWKREIQYARHRIIDLDGPRGTYRSSTGSDTPIRRLSNIWTGAEGDSSQKNQYRRKNAHRLARVRNYVRAERKRRMAIRTKQGITETITHIREMGNETTGSIAQKITGSSRQR